MGPMVRSAGEAGRRRGRLTVGLGGAWSSWRCSGRRLHGVGPVQGDGTGTRRSRPGLGESAAAHRCRQRTRGGGHCRQRANKAVYRAQWQRVSEYFGHRDGVVDVNVCPWNRHCFATASLGAALQRQTGASTCKRC